MSRERERERERDRDRDRDRERERDRERDRERISDRDRERPRSRERERGRDDRGRGDDDRRRKEREDEEWQKRFGNKASEKPKNEPFRGHERRGPQKDLPNPFLSDNKGRKPDVWGKKEEEGEPIEKEQKNFKTSGALNKAARTDEKTGIELKYIEPEEGAQPGKKWRLYPFKGEEALEPYKIHRQSYYLMGRDRNVVHIPLDHPSCSKQHAVIQFRMINIDDELTGQTKTVIRPYLMDLGSTNGSFLNGVKIDDSRYIELKEKDVLKFGNSSREFVLLHEGTRKADELSDD